MRMLGSRFDDPTQLQKGRRLASSPTSPTTLTSPACPTHDTSGGALHMFAGTRALSRLPEAVNAVWDRAIIPTRVIQYSDIWVMPTFLTLPLVAAVPAEQMSA
jgi:hypothetical protein